MFRQQYAHLPARKCMKEVRLNQFTPNPCISIWYFARLQEFGFSCSFHHHPQQRCHAYTSFKQGCFNACQHRKLRLFELYHVGHKAAVAPAASLIIITRPHDLDAGQIAKPPKLLLQNLLIHLWCKIACAPTNTVVKLLCMPMNSRETNSTTQSQQLAQSMPVAGPLRRHVPQRLLLRGTCKQALSQPLLCHAPYFVTFIDACCDKVHSETEQSRTKLLAPTYVQIGGVGIPVIKGPLLI